jgi:hypothetical protein
MAKPLKIDWLIGRWRYEDAVRPCVFAIDRTAHGFRVQAVDESDGEELVVSKVKLEGNVLTFETLTPSNNWRTRNRLRLISKTKAVHELTFWEEWKKFPTTKNEQRICRKRVPKPQKRVTH